MVILESNSTILREKAKYYIINTTLLSATLITITIHYNTFDTILSLFCKSTMGK